MAALFCEENRFPLIDEPTNHLDVQARKIVANYLKKKTGIKIFDPAAIPENKRNNEFLKFDVLVKQLKDLKLDISNFDIKGFEDF